jgi:hypothetical protein
MDMKSYCHRQIDEAKKYKWIQSQKAGHDLGDDAVNEWVVKFAAEFRKEYNEVYGAMLNHVVEETIKELNKSNIPHDDDLVKKIVAIAINKFTSKWTVDMSNSNHNIHTDLL